MKERNKSNKRSIKEEDSGEAKDISDGRKKETEQTEEVKLISRVNHGALQMERQGMNGQSLLKSYLPWEQMRVDGNKY